MRRGLRWAVAFPVGAAVAAVLPLYPRRVMTRGFGESGGDLVTWTWERVSLSRFVDAMSSMRPEEKPRLWLWIDIGLAAAVALLLAAVGVLLWGALSRRKLRAGTR